MDDGSTCKLAVGSSPQIERIHFLRIVKPDEATSDLRPTSVATRTRGLNGSTDDVANPPGRSAGPPDPFITPAERPRELPGPSVKLALIVLLLAAGIVMIGILAMVFWGSSRPVTAPSAVATAKGSPLTAVPAAPDLAPLVSSGEPPDDVVNSLVLPVGSVAGSVQDNTNSAESYDEQRSFTLNTSEQNVITFFEVELPARGWHVVSKGPPKNQSGFEVLAQRAGSDGYYWEVGAVVAPTSFSGSGSATKTGRTQYEIRLFQIQDDQ